MSFSNKVVLVTGASSGIGAATAIIFAKHGANIAIVGRNETKLRNVAAEIEKHGKNPLVIKADVSKDDDCKRIINGTLEKFGKLDVLINNAGIERYGCLLDGKLLETYDEIMGTNMRAVVNLTMLAVPHLIQTKGNVVNVSSICSEKVLYSPLTAYCISKAALDQFTKAAAKELATSRVRVNSVNPGPVKTDLVKNAGKDFDIDANKGMTALNRVSESEEIAELIMFLAGDKAKGITGSIFVSDNGMLIK